MFRVYTVLDLDNTSVKKECNHIDIYMTDGKQSIIIENKINALDQPEQLYSYINTVKKDSPDNLYVIYLSRKLNEKKVSEQSLKDYTIKDNYIYDDKTPIANFKDIYHDSHILTWLRKCQTEVSHIVNINESLRQYIRVVEKLTKIPNFDYLSMQGKYLLKHPLLYEEIAHEFASEKIDATKEYNEIKKLYDEVALHNKRLFCKKTLDTLMCKKINVEYYGKLDIGIEIEQEKDYIRIAFGDGEAYKYFHQRKLDGIVAFKVDKTDDDWKKRKEIPLDDLEDINFDKKLYIDDSDKIINDLADCIIKYIEENQNI